jgi:phytoene dehydrogenase-like protein
MILQKASEHYDLAIIGAGLGGLLAAALASKHNKRVVILEKTSKVGGRFSGQLINGAQLSSGALHLIPHGSRGPLSKLLKQVGIDVSIVESDVFCSLWTRDKHRTYATAKAFFLDLPKEAKKDGMKLLLLSKVRPNAKGSVQDMLDKYAKNSYVHDLTSAFINFSFSMSPSDLPWQEFCKFLDNLMMYKGPGIPYGGCRAVSHKLAEFVTIRNGSLLLQHKVTKIHLENGHWIVEYLHNGIRNRLSTTKVISDIGSKQTKQLLQANFNFSNYPKVARGFKVQFLSPTSLIAHKGIMFCIGTKRISGIVQVSNADPGLAPPGYHLLNTFQIASSDAGTEKTLAMEDLKIIFPDTFDKLKFLSAELFDNTWPVNRAAQGYDLRSQKLAENFYLVGDETKPSGFIMAEGVASSVLAIKDAIV